MNDYLPILQRLDITKKVERVRISESASFENFLSVNDLPDGYFHLFPRQSVGNILDFRDNGRDVTRR